MMTEKSVGRVQTQAIKAGTNKVVYSLADCEEGRVYINKFSDQFRYPSNDSDDDCDHTDVRDKRELFRWHYADETDTNPVIEKQVHQFQDMDLRYVNSQMHELSKSEITTCKLQYNHEEVIHKGDPTPINHTNSPPLNTETSASTAKPKGSSSVRRFFNSTTKSVFSKRTKHLDAVNKRNLVPHDDGNKDEVKVQMLKQALDFYGKKLYEEALSIYEEGFRKYPSANEFENGIYRCKRKIKTKGDTKKVKMKLSESSAKEHISTVCWSESVLETEEYISGRQHTLLSQIERYYSQGEFLKAMEFCEHGLELYPKSVKFPHYKQRINEAIQHLLGLHRVVYDSFHKKLLIKLIQAQNFFEREDTAHAISVCKDIIKADFQQSSNEKSDEANYSYMSCVYNILGLCSSKQGLYRKAISCHLTNLQIALENDDDELKVRALTNAGHVYVKMNQYEKAICVWKQLLQLQTDITHDKPWLYNHIGQCYLELGNHEMASQSADMAITFAEEVDQPQELMEAYLLSAQAAIRRGCPLTSKEAFQRAIKFADQIGNTEASSSIKQALEEIEDILSE